MFGWVKAIWRIRALKESRRAYQNKQLDRSRSLLDVVGTLGRVAEALKLEDLKRWTENELNGYAAGDGTASGRQQGMAAGGMCRGAAGLMGGSGRAAAGMVVATAGSALFIPGLLEPRNPGCVLARICRL